MAEIIMVKFNNNTLVLNLANRASQIEFPDLTPAGPWPNNTTIDNVTGNAKQAIVTLESGKPEKYELVKSPGEFGPGETLDVTGCPHAPHMSNAE